MADKTADNPFSAGSASADSGAGSSTQGLLSGVRVVEFAQIIAGPFAGTLLADMGADVVHVEPPGVGDQARLMGPSKDGVPLWWKVLGRNKRSVTLDLHQQDGRRLARDLVRWADIVIVTFRHDTAQRFGLDWESVSSTNPSAILLQISGFGADSSRRNEPGFGKVGEARSGVVHLTGFDRPVHTGFSHGDATTGLMGAFAAAAALVKRNSSPTRRGEWIDLALFETLFRLVDWQVILRDQLGEVPQRMGNSLAVAPGAVVNTFLSEDGQWITVTTATQRSIRNVISAIGLSEEDFPIVGLSVDKPRELERHLGAWIETRSADDALKILMGSGVTASKVYDIDDIMSDATYLERNDIVEVDDVDLGVVRMPGIVPKIHTSPTSVWRAAPALGQDNREVFLEWLDMTAEEYADLASRGVV